jgi:hypothetical protein
MREKFKNTWLRNIVPTYHNYPNYRGYSVKVSPVGWRRFPLFRKRAYFVGDKVILSIALNPVSEEEVKKNRFEIAFYEIHPNGFKIGHDIKDMKRERKNIRTLEGSIISRSGNFSIYLGTSSVGYDEQAPILTAEIMHRDKRDYDIFLVVVTLIGSCIIGVLLWLLGFIQIVPFWKIFKP